VPDTELAETGMAIISIKNAQANFDSLLDRARAGEEIIIARGRKPVARLLAFPADVEASVEPSKINPGR